MGFGPRPGSLSGLLGPGEKNRTTRKKHLQRPTVSLKCASPNGGGSETAHRWLPPERVAGSLTVLLMKGYAGGLVLLMRQTDRSISAPRGAILDDGVVSFIAWWDLVS